MTGDSESPALRRLIFRPARLSLIGLICFNFIYIGRVATQRYLAFETGAFDLGVYAQPLWNFIHGHGFYLSLQDATGSLRWADHIEPILFLIAPIYALWPDPRTLLWLQAAGLSLAGLPLFGLAARRLQNEWAALVIVLAYFLLPAAQAVMLFDFHAVAQAPLFLLGAFFFLDRALALQGQSLWLWPDAPPLNAAAAGVERKMAGQAETRSLRRAYGLAGLFFLLALSTKEDISLHVFMIGLYLLALRRRWREGGSLMIVGLIWFYGTFEVLIPFFRTSGKQSLFVGWFETLGRTPAEIALAPLTAPAKVLNLILRPDNLPPLAMITIPLALLPVAGLPFLAMAAPSLAFSLLSQNPTPRQFETWHYTAPMLAFILLAAVDGLARISYYGPRLLARLRPGSRLASRPVITTGLTVLLLITALTYQYLRGYSFLSALPEWPEVTAHHQLGRELAATIPPEAHVLAQAQLAPSVAHRQEVAIWSGPLDTDYDYIWLDLSHPRLPNRFNAHAEFLTGMIIEHSFGPVAAKDGYLLLKKGAERIPLPEELFSFTEYKELPARAQRFAAVFGDTLQLVAVQPDVRRLATSETEPQVVLYFEALRQPAEDYHLFIYQLDQTGAITGATDYAQPALYWWPTSRWQAGDQRQVRVNTIPWWTGDNTLFSSTDQPVFGYAIGFSRRDDPWDVSARLPVRLTGPANPPGSQPLDDDTLLSIIAFHRVAGLPRPAPLISLGRTDAEGF
jgi:uncharacterized membrane protein